MPKKFIHNISFILLFAGLTYAAPLTFVPIQLTQPDGIVLNVFASGDEFYNWVHDKDNYTIILDSSTGFYVYAALLNGKLVPTNYIVGKVNPADVNLIPGINVFPSESKKFSLSKQIWDEGQSNTAVDGVRYNLVVFIRFKNEPEFSDSKSTYDNMLNSLAGPSTRHFYKEVSGGILDVVSNIYPESSTIVSYQDTQERNYFLKYDATTNPTGYKDGEAGARENALLRRALDFITPQIPLSSQLDGNSDGTIDNVIFIVLGASAAWADLLWPHMTSLSGSTYKINGKRVYSYNFQLQKSISWAVLNHEMGHSLGMPDLYRYSDKTITPVGSWDLMSNNNINMCNYMKWRYLKWITTIPEITQDGTYWLKKSSAATKNIYKIKSPRSTKEYFILEYRFKEGLYEKNLPGTGLLVYRVNENVHGNANGPPDGIYYYRPGGSLTVNGTLNQAYFGSNYGRTKIDDLTDPSSFLSDGLAGGLKINNIGIAGGDSISFNVEIVKTLDIKNDFKVENTTYNWIDISKTGTVINNWMNGFAEPDSSFDDGYSQTSIPLGFDFSFYNTKYNSIYVGINGLVSFTTKYLNVSADGKPGAPFTKGYYNSDVVWPGNTFFQNSIAISYNDYDLNKNDLYGGGIILYETIGDKFILTWMNVGSAYIKGDTSNTFQLVLDKTKNSIICNYKNFNTSTVRSSMKIGLQKDNTNGIGWFSSLDIPNRTPQNNSAVIFYPNIITAISNEELIPSVASLEQNYPNPFNTVTVIRYKVQTAGLVTIKVFDLLGREIATLINEEKQPGVYNVSFNVAKLKKGGSITSGVYFYSIRSNNFYQTKKMVVLK